MSRSTDSTGEELSASQQSLPHMAPARTDDRLPDSLLASLAVSRADLSSLPPSMRAMPTVSPQILPAEKRRARVKTLIEEEGLGRGAVARIAGWLDVSPSTIARDVRRLVELGDPVVTAAFERAVRRRQLS